MQSRTERLQVLSIHIKKRTRALIRAEPARVYASSDRNTSANLRAHPHLQTTHLSARFVPHNNSRNRHSVLASKHGTMART